MLGEATFTHVVRDDRALLMGRIREQLDRDAAVYGIAVVDVRIRRADLPEQNSQAVYQRMQTERQREAAEFRAQGTQRAQEIRSRADREAKNEYLRQLVAWSKTLPGSDRSRHDAEAAIRGFFMKNGFRVMTKPYQDVYRRSAS